MRFIRGMWRKVLFVCFAHKIIKTRYQVENGVWSAWVDLPKYGAIAFEDVQGRYHFTW